MATALRRPGRYRFVRHFGGRRRVVGPEGQTVITADFTASENSELWNTDDEELIKQVIDGLVEGGFIDSADVFDTHIFRHKFFYPRYDLAYVEKMKFVSDKLRNVENLLTTGRIGMYNYNNSDHCFDMGKFIADGLSANQTPNQIWVELEDRVQNYKIVD